MFEKQQKKSYTDLLGKTNRIVEGTTIKGDIISQADFRLDGNLIGNFNSTGRLVIGPAGSVTGDIKCNTADIEGKFNGKIEVTDMLSIKSKASIKGEVIVGKLAVEPGADFSATCVMMEAMATGKMPHKKVEINEPTESGSGTKDT
ncbi:polymer-forming cytoskeletal protein [Flavobacterium sp. WV_118_3]|uniref:bactofilin family protein n=1 Tax=Flavobacterium sp. WV_118_3 TaxID=3151764 RepID=UPI0012CB8E0B|nr:polymer-forming cytoskeletal protein [Flavobacterium sp.]HRB72233.1 polymer-forming cytoskeletal protein [Flavobacterium sp.]